MKGSLISRLTASDNYLPMELAVLRCSGKLLFLIIIIFSELLVTIASLILFRCKTIFFYKVTLVSVRSVYDLKTSLLTTGSLEAWYLGIATVLPVGSSLGADLDRYI